MEIHQLLPDNTHTLPHLELNGKSLKKIISVGAEIKMDWSVANYIFDCLFFFHFFKHYQTLEMMCVTSSAILLQQHMSWNLADHNIWAVGYI